MRHSWLVILTSLCWAQLALAQITGYHDYTAVMDRLSRLKRSNPFLTRLYSIGRSVEGRHLAVLQISRNANRRRELGEPMVKLVGNMHGNEAVAHEMMLEFATFLLKEQSDPRIARILNTIDLHILVSLNPDGFEKRDGTCEGQAGRHNANDKDLNREFPKWQDKGQTLAELMWKNETEERQPEAQAAIKWIMKHPFVLSGNVHDGAVLVNYPFDDGGGIWKLTKEKGVKSPSPDDAFFVGISKLYANKHKTMHLGRECKEESHPGGITNGAFWYVVSGGMQDFNYHFTNCMEVTFELACCKQPPVEQLQVEFDNNKEALLSFVEAAMTGVRGIVSSDGKPAPEARIEVASLKDRKLINHHVMTTERGEYWRLLAPGIYGIRAVRWPHVSAWKKIRVHGLDSKKHVRVDLELKPKGKGRYRGSRRKQRYGLKRGREAATHKRYNKMIADGPGLW